MEYFSDYVDFRNYMKFYKMRMCKQYIWEYIIYRCYPKYITYGFRIYATPYPKFVDYCKELRFVALIKGYDPAKYTHDYDLFKLFKSVGKSQYIMSQWKDIITIYK